MSSKLMKVLISAVSVVVLLLAGLFGGLFDGLLGKMNLSLAGHPPVAEAPASVVEAPAKPAAVATLKTDKIVPVFDVVRVEPTGEAVIAGQAAPDSRIEVLSNGETVASGVASDTGAWAIVPTAPLASGAHDLSVRATAPDGKVEVSQQSVAVSVPEDGKKDVLVVLNQPGNASTVLEAPGVQATAAATPAGSSAATSTGAEAAAVAPTPPATAEASASPAPAASQAGPAPAASSSAETTVASASSEPAATTATNPAAAEQSVVKSDLGANPPAQPETAMAGTSVAGAPVADAPAAETEQKPAEATLPPATAASAEATASATGMEATGSSPVAAQRKVTVDAVELEDGKTLYAAGAAEAGTTVRLYVDAGVVGDSVTEAKGRWLYKGELDLTAGHHVVRADEIDAAGKVLARAEVPFDIAENLTIAGTGTGSAQLGTGLSGSAGGAPSTIIIRQGDNLWTIARRLYGLGVRYSTIYQANTDQIRNPDLIYPGQVFVLPEGDRAWKPVEN